MRSFFCLIFTVLLFGFQLRCQAASTAVNANIAKLIQSAQNEYAAGNYATAISKYKKALEGNNNNPGIHFGLGTAYIGEGYYELATEYFLRALELNPALIEAYFSLALAYQAMGRKKEALAVYRKGLGFDLNKDLPRSTFWNEVNIRPDETDDKNQDDEDNFIESNKSEEKNLSTLKIKEFKPPIIITENIFNNTVNETVNNIDESGAVIIKKDNNYYASQIEDYEEELRKSPDDSQSMRRLALLYLKINQIDKAQSMQINLKNINSEFSEEIAKEIDKAQKKLKADKDIKNPKIIK